MCLYFYSQAEWLLPFHQTTKNTCKCILIMLLITNQCSMCFPQFKWDFHGAICMISQPLCEQNSQRQFKPAGFYCLCHCASPAVWFCQTHFFYCIKWNPTKTKELYTKLQKKHCRIKHKDQSCPCAGWCAATYSFFELQLKHLALILTPHQISTLSGERAIIKRSCFFWFFFVETFFLKTVLPPSPFAAVTVCNHGNS